VVPPPPTEPEPKTLAIAFGDLNANHSYDAGDVLIGKLVDTNRDNVPSIGDTIMMGKYPTTLTPTYSADYADWGKKSHTVDGVTIMTATYLRVTSAGGQFNWWRQADWESYSETIDDLASAWAFDSHTVSEYDYVGAESGSPSGPSNLPLKEVTRGSDDPFIDVALTY
jgi:hypothetical protein